MSRILSIDYGAKRTGMAWTDPLQLSINPLPTILTSDFDICLTQLIESDDISDIVFGLPSHADGQLTQIGHTVKKLVERLQKTNPNISIHTIDESFTSKRASQLMVHLGVKKKNRAVRSNIDKMSAVLILKDFMDKK